MAPYKIQKVCYLLKMCLVDSRKMLLFVTELIFLLKEEAWSMTVQIHNAQQKGERGRENLLCLNFFCLAIKYINFMSWMCTGS